ncbi:hypothetical protein PGT21_027877 [Puccinia graminis f. sp. tritici]|uniref:Uncharacterized protein n=1 Tax=Puccinia graminis f. sp. tritici TaxID=56615 RepID=A0A5B0MXK8_PUCGR|nr:hypothetical protein PGT21_027877 [Puccinia graminis f. sp. tritici]KAA1131182.1 hypothetical protein PGTUg99_021945 [Puccinia graminis f. sp. tritici]
MPSPLSIFSLLLTSSSLLLSVLGDQGTSPVRRHMLEKRSSCFVINQRKGCVDWGSAACCQDCCSRFYAGEVAPHWGIDCRCPTAYQYQTPSTVVVTPGPAQQAAPIYVTQPAPVYVAQPQPVYVAGY